MLIIQNVEILAFNVLELWKAPFRHGTESILYLRGNEVTQCTEEKKEEKKNWNSIEFLFAARGVCVRVRVCMRVLVYSIFSFVYIFRVFIHV